MIEFMWRQGPRPVSHLLDFGPGGGAELTRIVAHVVDNGSRISIGGNLARSGSEEIFNRMIQQL